MVDSVLISTDVQPVPLLTHPPRMQLSVHMHISL